MKIMMSKESKAEERKWQIQSALSTLQRAEEIKNDTSLMRDVKKAAGTEAKRLQTLANGGGIMSSARKAPVKKVLTKKK
jgi:uncharacterized protein (UPF0147 family)